MGKEQALDLVKTEIARGLTLIEASAGTGKTFAISMFVLRAVVEQKIPVEKILVVTFTVAATEELRARIRARLAQGRDILKGVSSGDDPILRLWADSIENPVEALLLIDLALKEIDRAAIYTIHGFCQRMLTEQALESGELFEVELTGDGDLVKTALLKDYWRLRLYSMEKRYCSIILDRYSDPERLYRSVSGAEDPLGTLIPEPKSFENACSAVDRNLEAFLCWWKDNAETLRQCVDEASTGGFLKKELNSNYRRWFEELESCLRVNLVPPVSCLQWLQKNYIVNQLNGNRLRGESRRLQFLESWPLPDPLVEPLLMSLESVYLEIRLELVLFLREQISKRLVKQGKISFDDLVVRLARAVKGAQGGLLCRRIAKRYQMVLIDEFQDTDSAQWLIFNRIFGAGEHFLYLIGDPKQAIYRFRGADIFSYYEARVKAERILTLGTNYRSHPQLMDAVNDLFSGFGIGGITYCPVLPAKKADEQRLWGDGRDLSGLIYCQLAEPPDNQSRWYAGAAQERIRDWVAEEIVQLLSDQKQVEIQSSCFSEKTVSRRVMPADIAILVRTNKQAEEFRDSLMQSNVPAVVASKTKVFDTLQCQQLLLVMQAVASPGSIKLLKTALSCGWFSLSGDQHVAVCRDEKKLDKWIKRFQHYCTVWHDNGFLSMLNQLIVDENVFISLCTIAGGARQIANIQHLGELVQEAEQKNHFGVEQTIQWLHRVSIGSFGEEETELRLESDEDAVHIITMHGAKGLEYPVTFCPCLLSASASAMGAELTRFHDENNRLLIDIGSKSFEQHKAWEEEELFQEDIRLAYVSVTRAQLRCYLFWADVQTRGNSSGSFSSPLGLMLFDEGPCDFDSQKGKLEKFGHRETTEYRLISADSTQFQMHWLPEQKTGEIQTRRRGQRLLQTNRTLTSFSGLTLFSRHDDEVLAGAFDERAKDAGFAEISRLPGGVRFGNVVHDALEKLSFSQIVSENYDKGLISSLCQQHGLDVDLKALNRLLINCVSTHLSTSTDQICNFTLSGLEDARIVKEMGFSLHMKGTDTSKINEILGSQKTYASLSHRGLEGFLNGFIDLVCCHNERFYVIDYKTNYLGDDPSSYSYERMQAAMRAHNYGLQYWLYLLVVHRYLSSWLPNYSYENHFGGVIYLFVRGMVPERAGSGVFYDLPEVSVLEQLNRCFDGAS